MTKLVRPDRNECIANHCSNFPRSFFGQEVEISELDVLGESLGRDRCFGAVKGKVKAGPMTFFRMDTDDTLGCARAYVGQGEFTDDPCAMDGGISVCRVENIRKLMGYICAEGFEHHIAMVRGSCAKPLHEATSKYLGWDVHWHEGPAD